MRTSLRLPLLLLVASWVPLDAVLAQSFRKSSASSQAVQTVTPKSVERSRQPTSVTGAVQRTQNGREAETDMIKLQQIVSQRQRAQQAAGQVTKSMNRSGGQILKNCPRC